MMVWHFGHHPGYRYARDIRRKDASFAQRRTTLRILVGEGKIILTITTTLHPSQHHTTTPWHTTAPPLLLPPRTHQFLINHRNQTWVQRNRNLTRMTNQSTCLIFLPSFFVIQENESNHSLSGCILGRMLWYVAHASLRKHLGLKAGEIICKLP